MVNQRPQARHLTGQAQNPSLVTYLPAGPALGNKHVWTAGGVSYQTWV